MKRLEAAFKPESKYRAFFLSIITFGLAYGLYKGVIDNYLAEIVGMSGFDKGVSEFFRELPGLLLIFILAVLYMFSAERIYKLGALFMLAGMAAQALVPASRVLVILCIFVLVDYERLLMKWKEDFAPATPDTETWDERFCQAVRHQIPVGYAIECLISADPAERKDMMDYIRDTDTAAQIEEILKNGIPEVKNHGREKDYAA